MLQPLCSLPEGEVGSVLGGGPGARPAMPAGGLARGPLLGVETGWAVLVSVGGGLGGTCGGSRASLGSGVQEAVMRATPPTPH